MSTMDKMKNFITQSWPPKPTFTDANVPAGSQVGRVFVVTGGNSGVGFELCKILYKTGATVYLTTRSEVIGAKAINAIKASVPPTTAAVGQLTHLCLDLNDLQSVKYASQFFAARESRLDVLWHNAGVDPNDGQPTDRTAQGLEPMVAIHCVAPLLLTQLLLPQLKAAVNEWNCPRVVWSASALIDSTAPPSGVDFTALKNSSLHGAACYAMSKAGAWILSREMVRRYGSDGIISVASNPGNLDTTIYKGTPGLTVFFRKATMLYNPIMGAYTELYAGLSGDISLANNGIYVMPWGRLRSDETHVRGDIIRAVAPEEEGGMGYGSKFWDWCDDHADAFK